MARTAEYPKGTTELEVAAGGEEMEELRIWSKSWMMDDWMIGIASFF